MGSSILRPPLPGLSLCGPWSSSPISLSYNFALKLLLPGAPVAPSTMRSYLTPYISSTFWPWWHLQIHSSVGPHWCNLFEWTWTRYHLGWVCQRLAYAWKTHNIMVRYMVSFLCKNNKKLTLLLQGTLSTTLCPPEVSWWISMFSSMTSHCPLNLPKSRHTVSNG